MTEAGFKPGPQMPHSVQASEIAGAVYSFGPEADNRVLAKTGYDPRAFGTSAIVWEGMTQAEIDNDVENAWADHDYEPWVQKQDEIEACWDVHGSNRRGNLADIIEAIGVEKALARLNTNTTMGFDIDIELGETPAAEWAVEYNLITDPKPSIKEASIEAKIRVLRELNGAIGPALIWSQVSSSRGLSAEAGKVEVHTEEEVDAARDVDASRNEFDPYARLDVFDAAVE